MPERQSTPGGATAEQDAEAEPRGPAPLAPDEEPTRPVTRSGDTATVNLRRGVTSSRAGDRPAAARTPNGPAQAPTGDRSASNPDGHPAASALSATFDYAAASNLDGHPAASALSATFDYAAASSPDGQSVGPASGATSDYPAARPSDHAVSGAASAYPAARIPDVDAAGPAWSAAPGDSAPPSDRGVSGAASAHPAARTPDADATGPASGAARDNAARPSERAVSGPADGRPAASTSNGTYDHAAAPTLDQPLPGFAVDRNTDAQASDPAASTSTAAYDVDAAQATNAHPPSDPIGDGTTATPEAGPADVTRPSDSPIVVPSTRPEAETTQVLPAPDAPTVQLAAHPGPAAEAPTVAQPGLSTDEPTPPAATRSRRRRILLIGGGVVAAVALLYGGDLAFASGSVPRGVTVEGVAVGGLAYADAEQTLRAQIEPRTTRPVPITVGGATSAVDPRTAGLTVDWSATLAQAEHQPLNPVTRVASFFTTRETRVITKSDPAALDGAIAELRPAFDKPAVEGNVRFEGTTPRPVQPAAGQQLDAPAAAALLTRDWASGNPVALPLSRIEPITTPDDVTAALEIAEPAVSAPITVSGENGISATLTPQNIAAALTFRADPAAGLVPDLNLDAITKALQPQLADSETPGRDATLDFTGTVPVVVPSQDGRGVDYPATVKALLPMLTASSPRQVAAVYGEQPAKLTTEGLAKLGISGIIGEFTTRGFAADSGMNIKRAAAQINGAIVQPGATFSLNATTNPRDAAHGYVEAGIIEDGHPARGIGGGVSQVATTLYNASYFAGMTNVEHKEHSFYISRYPAGREATVFDNLIDLKFRNDNPTAVMIQTAWAPGSITVRIYGTKHYDVTSTTGPRTNRTEPKTVTIPDGEECTPSNGSPGFTVTDTRTLKDINTGQVHSETRTVRYNPSPTIECGDD